MRPSHVSPHDTRGPLAFTAAAAVLVLIALAAVGPRPATEAARSTPAATATPSDRSAYLGPSAKPPQAAELHSELVKAPGDVTIGVGQTATVSLTYRNTGAERWIKGSPSEIHLGVKGDSRAFADLAVDWLGPTRPAVQAEAEVLPGAIATFTFKVKGVRPGVFRIPLLPVCEGISWLQGDATLVVNVR